VARYLKQRVPSNVISIVSLTREPETVDEAEYHLARLRPRTKMVRAYYWTVLVLLTLLWLLGARAEVLYLAFLSLPGLYVVWYRQRQARREESKYLAIREQLLAEANDASPE
jgi:Flp pilus assembly protein TadB